jgi:ribosomal protein S18 acetylase RimI-like enzyme
MTQIRNYQDADKAKVVDLWNQLFPYSTGHNDPVASIERKVCAQDSLFFVAVDEQQVVGTVMAGYDGHRGWIYSLGVASTHQRSGIGSQLVQHAETVLARRGCPKVNLQVRADNAAVTAFYESLGYSVEQRVSMGKLI